MKSLIELVGRALLWISVAAVFLVGAGRLIVVIVGTDDDTADAGPRLIERAPTWPDNPARALAVQFTRDYWTLDPKDPDRYHDNLARHMSASLLAQGPPSWPRSTRLSVAALTVADERVVPGERLRALITVSATVTENKASPRVVYLTVPVAKDKSGGLVVFDLPSVSAGPSRGEDTGDTYDQLNAGEQVEIHGTLERFFTAYLAGDTPGLEYFTRPGARLHALPTPLELESVGAIGLTQPPRGNVREVVVDVDATKACRKCETPPTFPFRYRLRLEHGDRWYIATINQGGS